jgi:P-type Ca2+ transporter type 2C
MISGDHIDTCLYVATKVGIISEMEQNLDGIFMTGEQFRAAIGEYSKVWDPTQKKYTVHFNDKEKFKRVKGRLRIIARATAEDKFILIAGIKQAGGLVAMTGDSIADATALKEADVGLCMGSGCQVAKDHSDLVILDNNFASIYRSIKWGRAIFDNVRKFLQFQLTINISLCAIVILTGATLGHSPLNVI